MRLVRGWVVIAAVIAGCPMDPSGVDGGGAGGAGGAAAGGTVAGGSAGGSTSGGAAGGSSGGATGGGAAGGSAGGSTSGGAAGGSAGGAAGGGRVAGPIEACTGLEVPSLEDDVFATTFSCTDPGNTGGTIVPGVYKLTRGHFGVGYASLDAGVCVFGGTRPTGFRVRFTQTSDPRVFGYQELRGFWAADAGTFVESSVSGRARLSTDGLSIALEVAECDGGTPMPSSSYRGFSAGPTFFRMDCCRTSVPGGSGSPLDAGLAYIIEFTRE